MLPACTEGLLRRAATWAAACPRRAAACAAAYSTQAAAGAGSPAAAPRIALVQGASRGLGLEFVRQLVSRPEQVVVAACRKPDEADQLLDLRLRLPKQASERLHVVQLDCTKEASIEVRGACASAFALPWRPAGAARHTGAARA